MQPNRRQQMISAVFAFVSWMVLLGGSASGVTGHSVFSFNYANGTGYGTGLTVDESGNIWGTSYSGGAYEYGNVFELTRNTAGQWTETVLYSFTGGSDGENPIDDDGPLVDSAGNLYGTTVYGGTWGAGTVFKLTRGLSGWQESVLWNFTCRNDGCDPAASLVSDSAGNLYGTTFAGGPGGFGHGTVFMLSPDGNGNWQETTLHNFSGKADGAGPLSALVLDRSGNIYGTTSAGASSYCVGGCGVIFKLTPEVSGGWDEQVLYFFKGGKDGSFPIGKLVFDVWGNIYGVAQAAGDISCSYGYAPGCGTVFRLAQPKSADGQWYLSTLHVFTGSSDGASPSAGLIVDKTGALYGTAFGGSNGKCPSNFSTTPGCGTLYHLEPTLHGTWNFETLYSFSGTADGGEPLKVAFDGSMVYIPTSVGGSTDNYRCRFGGCGTIFQLSMTSQ
jgi:uncharacterized repeat protein (TIGR03803 family)